MKHSLVALLFISAALAAEPAPLDDASLIAKGSEVSAALLQKLGGEVKAKMQAGGPMNALHFCSQNALHLTEELSKENHVSLKRVSLKNRNPINTAEGEEQTLLSGWEKQLAAGTPLPPYELKRAPGQPAVFYKPIVINNEACLKCHGDLSPDSPVAKEIRTLYPEDKATGYKMGDLRGMIVVTFPE